MKPIHIVAADDERTRVPFIIPVKGRKPVQITLPRFDFIDEDQFDELTTELEKLDANNSDMPARKRGRMVALTMLKPFVTDTQYGLLESLATGQLDQILEGWRETSVMSLGESAASETSSTGNTGAPCEPTSSTGDGGDTI